MKDYKNPFVEIANEEETWEEGMMLCTEDIDKEETKELIEMIDKVNSKKFQLNQVIHHNYVDSDSGVVFCKKLHRVMEFDVEICSACEYCFGSLQGMGVECFWNDNIDEPIVSVYNPKKEYDRVSKLIKKGILSKG